jgi:hypothetical protein
MDQLSQENPMRRLRSAALSTVLCLPLLLGGCDEAKIVFNSHLVLFVALFSNAPKKQAAKRKKTKFEDKNDVQVQGDMGGLSGDYDMSLGAYGSIDGTAEIKGFKKAKIREDDNPSAHAVIEAALLDRLGLDVDVQLAKVKYNGRQTTGGVKKFYNLKITFSGVLASGDGVGNEVKGKLKLKGNFK